MQKKRSGKSGKSQETASKPFALLVFSTLQRRLLSALFPLMAVVAGLVYILPMTAASGGPGLPFDESYVSLSFARTLLEHGVYAMHQADTATTGVVAPLQVLLLAVMGLFSSDGVLLTFILGVLGFAVSAWLMFRLALLLFRQQQWLAVAAALMFVLSPRLASAAVAGLPTILLIVLLLASATAYFGRRPLLFFLFAGLALWIRPDAIVFLLAAVVHLIYSHAGVSPALRAEQSTGRPVTAGETRIGALLYLLLLAGYVAFNFVVGDGLLPNAVSATMAYYSHMITDYTGELTTFFSYSWSSLLLVFGLFGLLPLAAALLRRRPAPLLMSTVYVLGSILLFAVFHPVIRDYYVLLPTLPFFILIGVWGIARLTGFLVDFLPYLRTPALLAAFGLVIASAGMALSDWNSFRTAHYDTVKHILDRHVKMGLWASFNTPRDARIATNVPGTISYYGERSVLDMKGAVSPEVLPLIGNLPALLNVIEEKKVAYLITTREEFEIVNINPLVTSDINEPGIIEAFRYVPTRTHIMSQSASALNMEAVQLMQEKRFDAAKLTLERSLREDPLSSRSHTLLALVNLQRQDTSAAIDQLRKALVEHPHYAPAMVPLGDILIARRDWDGGLELLENAVRLFPQSAQAQASLDAAKKAREDEALRERGGSTFSFTIER
jgi:cytochrome c-type biogenesis protein CcmH/NrfG